jgi:hypothetical protein
MLKRELLKSALATTPDCLSPEQLELLSGAAEQNDPHVRKCPRCQAELALLKSFQSDAPLHDEGAAVAWISSQTERRLEQIKNPALFRRRGLTPISWWQRIFGMRRSGLLIPAAAVVAVAVASVVLLRPAKEPDLRADAGNRPGVFRSQEVEVIGPSGELPQAPTTLQWRVFPGAANYKVTVMEVDRSPLWTSVVNETEAKIPASLPAMMHPSKPVLWQVTALDAQGHSLATSQIYRFVVSRANP